MRDDFFTVTKDFLISREVFLWAVRKF